MKIDITVLLVAVIDLCAALITYRLIPWIKAQYNAKQWETVQSVVKVAVYAAEQMLGAGCGTEKYQYAMRYAADKLDTMGLKVDKAQIEAAVKDMNLNIFEEIEIAGDVTEDAENVE